MGNNNSSTPIVSSENQGSETVLQELGRRINQIYQNRKSYCDAQQSFLDSLVNYQKVCEERFNNVNVKTNNNLHEKVLCKQILNLVTETVDIFGKMMINVLNFKSENAQEWNLLIQKLDEADKLEEILNGVRKVQ
jgi:hypothetical protein